MAIFIIILILLVLAIPAGIIFAISFSDESYGNVQNAAPNAEKKKK